jgi:geranylgeranyl diphosphate synthase type I
MFNSELKSILADEHLSVYSLLRYCMGWEDINGDKISSSSGKRLRPSLCMFACDAVGGDIQSAIYASASIELIHNFSLIHDEVQDFDEIRHHRPTLWSLYGSQKALLAGNIMHVISHDIFRLSGDREFYHFRPASKLIGNACLDMIEGQYLDILYENAQSITIEQYLRMISLKTGALIRCSINLGALIGTTNRDIQNQLKISGESLGYAFQIRDDILGIWGQEKTTGKPVGVDIIRKKKSLPIIHAMNANHGKYSLELREIYQSENIGDFQVNRVLEIMDNVGTLEFARQMTKKYTKKARVAFLNARLNDVHTKNYIALLQFLMNRDY